MEDSSNLGDSINGAATPMLDSTIDGAVDYKGRPARRSNSGGWRAAAYTIGVEAAERFAFYGILSNLINYMTGPLGQSTATAAANVNSWNGAASLLPLFGALVADSFLGRYQTIVMSSLFYILGLGLLTALASLQSSKSSDCETNGIISCSPTSHGQLILSFLSLYLVAMAQSGHKPCIQAFGADQFNGQDLEESKAKSSFFNWWNFSISAGSLVATSVVSYIQDNLSWALGFGIPCIAMLISSVVFLLGTTTYRYHISQSDRSPFVRIGRVFITAFRNWRATPSAVSTEVESGELFSHNSSEQFKFVNKALNSPNHLKNNSQVCSLAEVEEAKAVLRLVPIWGTCLIFAIVYAQPSTFFIKQGASMDKTVFSGFEIPAASLGCIISLLVVTFIPIYDRIFVPIARAFTQNPSGITVLQRIGTGIFISIIMMIIAALVELKRLRISKEYNIVEKPSLTVPMSIWWLVPQYILVGIADIFTIVGLQELFYDQVPKELRSVGLALYLSVIGVGSFLSSFIVSVIDKATGGDGRDSWFSNNLNRAHLDYFYWLLAGLSAVGFSVYLYYARSYIYYRSGTT